MGRAVPLVTELGENADPGAEEKVRETRHEKKHGAKPRPFADTNILDQTAGTNIFDQKHYFRRGPCPTNIESPGRASGTFDKFPFGVLTNENSHDGARLFPLGS